MNFKVSVLIPCFNEVATIAEVLGRVLSVPYPLEVIVVDDASTDGTWSVLLGLEDPRVRCVRHEVNAGKGASIRTGLAYATGDFLLIQDADLEYNPSDYGVLLAPLLADQADVVYGSRFLFEENRRQFKPLYYWANYFLTWLSNCFTGLSLTDMETCYKAMRKTVYQKLVLCENRFGVEPEMTAKFSDMGIRVYEVGVHYAARSRLAGKKIGWRDGVRAVWCILSY